MLFCIANSELAVICYAVICNSYWNNDATKERCKNSRF